MAGCIFAGNSSGEGRRQGLRSVKGRGLLPVKVEGLWSCEGQHEKQGQSRLDWRGGAIQENKEPA